MTKIKTNRNNTNNGPPLRFPEFSGEWRYSLLGNECNILCGYPFDGQDMQESSGNVKLLRGINITEGEIRHSNELDRYYSGDISKLGKYILKEGDLVIGMDGSKVGRNSAILTICEQGSYLVQRVCRIRSQKHNVEYIFQHINNSKFHKYVDSIKTASAIPHISQSDIQDYTISFPPTAEEQIKITSLLSLLDARIATQNKIIEDLEQLKSALTDQLYSGQLRFHEFADDWGVSTFGHLTEHFSHRNRNSKHYPVFSVTKDTGFIPQEEQFESREITGDDISSYKIIRQGEFAYNPARINVGSIARYDNETPCLISSLYVCIKPAADIDSDWLLYLLKSKRAIFYYNLYGEGGVRIYLFYPNFSRIKVKVPSIQEQHRIAALLKYIADKILQEKKLKDLYMAQKQFLLQRLFI